MAYVYYTAEDGSTHLCHADEYYDDYLEHGFLDNAKAKARQTGVTIKRKTKQGLNTLKNNANELTVKVGTAAFDKAVSLVSKELNFMLTSNEKAILTQLFNKLKSDLQDEGSLYKFVKREIMDLRDRRQKAQDIVISMYGDANKAYNAANSAYADYEALSPAAKKKAKSAYNTAASTAKRYLR